ncbi:MAG: hypothetical protein ABIS18_03550 [Actinomycetota bacterium]
MDRSILTSLKRVLLATALAGGLAVLAPAAADPTTVRLPCDPLDPALCLLPFPNDRFTTTDLSTDTDRKIDFQLAEMPRSAVGKPIDPTEWNRNDGFSPGSMLMTFVPGLDLHRTWGTPTDHISDIGRYAAANAPILIVDAATGERWPFWSELDRNSLTADGERLLIIRPAINFLEGHRYLVALRNMKDAAGNTIDASPQFAAYRDGAPGPMDPTFDESRRGEVNGIINTISDAEAARGNGFIPSKLFLTWQFTVASERNLSERVLHIRDDAFAQLGDTVLNDGSIQGSTSPAFKITAVTPKTGNKLRQVDGTITVPNYLDRHPTPVIEKDPVAGAVPGQVVGGRFLYGLDGLPIQNPVEPTIDIPFVCTIPSISTPAIPAHPMLYGHGLLGSRNESTGGSTDRDRERNFMACAVNWMGFAEYDIGNAVATLADPSNMPTMADRSQQGFLNFLYLGRALVHPNGLAADPAFRSGGLPLFQTGELFYDGNSQGGIMGAALTALSVDFTRATLGVPGMNYSTLLNRSVDWEGPLIDQSITGDLSNPDDHLPAYSSVLYSMFPDKKEQQLVMGLLQMLWDRAEGNGYAQHITSDPYPNTPAHQVLMHAAYGDFQVANISAEVEARTMGARVMDTALMPGRHWDAAPYFGLAPFPRSGSTILPWSGSALVYWDSGNLPPPNANVPPLLDGGDPHEDPRRDHNAAEQKRHFWLTGEIIDVMNGGSYLLCRPGYESYIPRVQSQFAIADWCVAP